MPTSIFSRARDLLGRSNEPAREPTPPAAPKKRTMTWHAVSVAPGYHCCAEAKALEGQRFLSRDAPPLPLKDCNRGAECSCRYEHHEDRRKGPRRARDIGVTVDGWYEGEQRGSKRGRRKTDK